MKRLLALLLCGCLSLCILYGCASTSTKELQSQIDELKKENESLKDELEKVIEKAPEVEETFVSEESTEVVTNSQTDDDADTEDGIEVVTDGVPEVDKSIMFGDPDLERKLLEQPCYVYKQNLLNLKTFTKVLGQIS